MTITTLTTTYFGVPRIFLNAQKLCKKVKKAILTANEDELATNWGVVRIYDDRLRQWIKLIKDRYACQNSSILQDIFGIDL